MNYIKRIKLLGFKKIEPTVVCLCNSPIHGLCIKTLQKSLEDSIGSNSPPFSYPFVQKESYNRIQSYKYKLSSDITMYLIIVKEQYTLIVEDRSILDKKDRYGIIYRDQISIPVEYDKLNDGFWKYILSRVGEITKREIILKDILSFK